MRLCDVGVLSSRPHGVGRLALCMLQFQQHLLQQHLLLLTRVARAACSNKVNAARAALQEGVALAIRVCTALTVTSINRASPSDGVTEHTTSPGRV